MAILVNKQLKQRIETDHPGDIVRLKAAGFVEEAASAKAVEPKPASK